MTMQLLVIDDEANQRRVLADYLRECGHIVHEAVAAEDALGVLDQTIPDVVLTDLRLPGADGVELIKRARAAGVDAAFVVLTAFGSIPSAVDAMRAGAHDYLTKPVRLDDLDQTLARLSARPKKAPLPDDPFEGLGKAMQAVKETIERVAPSDATVLVTGESGTGKEVVANRIHEVSRRARGPFVKTNCAALTESLLEAELFGHEKGAFTGAAQRRAGLFEAAQGGTILLDEIGDISLELQVRLLRVLQEKEVMRVGGRTPVPVDFRLIAATHRDLHGRADKGAFRTDLLYRLDVIRIHVPPLRERPGDIAVLAPRLLQRAAERNKVEPRPLSNDALKKLVGLPLPGNVRQLQHLLERALLLARGPELSAADFAGTELADPRPDTPPTLRDAVAELEQAWIRDAMERCGNVRAQAARLLGIPDRVLRYKLRKYGLAPKRQK